MGFKGNCYTVIDDRYNVGLDALIRAEHFKEGSDDMLEDYYITTITVELLMRFSGYLR